ncbi:NADH:ubiquinone reductase (Na(+)-transporting) subunit C [Muribaculum intestinale]|jgi:Na+-transporting NADH:ubiquinone oxidoreductase subunit C|uniref:Na(+)-translocating NADH-quinone reductase subunit C n=1 Tax=Muribaculum intestinale TaxID=1796646 RepID=A0A1B1SAI7_9BACT|nr:NADH:ubiquinone reductase (Na(+)-transporting) subunit C [Muribaculum intestinale]ROT07948.1 NADH:ubiquinone reductase (Na(+)-transporting) subunit C [Muribaculaceae bacterium Isolate-100 (HZI)]RXE66471.1 NADH:ubiquinone reductase (Na(+)-transporting) subunit C [Muribaculaceae bacterium Isolate-007 (NCI)]GFI67786.1 Na(+)-translocating NADH-quinone reductase subunit C [Muribaculaceae bacterium]ANU63819.1 NADH:ubiquinone reductase (Na(+)-transporting) subunit C [Muribaculum intestinale]ASB380
MNKQSNVYTIIYIIVMVVVVGAALAFTSLGLKSRQQENINADKMKQILASVHITPAKDSVTTDFDRYITRSFIVNSLGDELPGNAFDVNTAEEAKKPVAERQLPVYECTVAPGDVKYIVPVNGAGLWGPIWGYVSINADGSTVYGAYFAHQGETPGLGAEIEKPAFSGQFEGKHMFKNGQFMPVAVVKAGQAPANGEDYVDGISGGTITSKGVGSMIDNCIGAYSKFLENLTENPTR